MILKERGGIQLHHFIVTHLDVHHSFISHFYDFKIQTIDPNVQLGPHIKMYLETKFYIFVHFFLIFIYNF
jgi:hypothetical protein